MGHAALSETYDATLSRKRLARRVFDGILCRRLDSEVTPPVQVSGCAFTGEAGNESAFLVEPQ